MRDDGEAMATGAPSRLLESMNRLLRGRVAVVSAPPGHAKHNLVRDWLARHPECHAAWVDDPQQLESTIERFHEGHLKPGELLVVVIAEESVLTDGHVVARALEFAERQAQVRLVFIGQRRPEAPLGSLAARGLLVDLDAAQLVWDRDEVATVLRPTNPDLTDEMVDQVMSLSAGWPTIVRMLAVEPLTFATTSKVLHLADSYIDSEVLAGVGEADLAFLEQLSVLPWLDPLAAAWMTGRGDAAAQLSRLQASGIPISWEDGNTIRLNPILRGFLARRLAEQDPQRNRELSQRAALWLRNRGRTLEAVELAMQVGMVDLAWMLAAEFVCVHVHRPELVESAPRLVSLMPPGWEVDVVRSVARNLASPETIFAQMTAIDPSIIRDRNTTGRLGYVALVLGVARRVGFPETLDISAALKEAAETDTVGIHELDLALLSVVRTEYGLWLLHQGRLIESLDPLMSALGIARVVNVPWVVVTSLSAMAYVHAEQGAVTKARSMAEEAIGAAEETTFTSDGLDELAMLALAMTSIDLGDLPTARRWLDRVAQLHTRSAENDAFRTCVSATYHCANDDPGTALRLVEAYRDVPRPIATPAHAFVIARCAFDASLALGEVAAAEREYTVMNRVDLPEGRAGLVVLEARLALTKGDARTAHALLEPHVVASQTHFEQAKYTLYMLMIFGVAADELHRADQALQAFQRAGVLADRMGLSSPSARHTRVAVASRQEVPLTEAERHVLANLDSGKTLGETAEALFISLNTLKTHLRRIYKKMGVANREEAIERARVMGLRG